MPSTNPLAVQLYSVRDELEANRLSTLQALAGAGYGAVEAYDPLAEPAAFKRLVDDLGLSICATHAPLLGPNRSEILDAVGVLGTDTVIVPSSPPERWSDAAGLDRLADELGDAAAAAAAAGIRVGYHNHWTELDHRIGDTSALEALAAQLDPSIILEVDTYWAHVAGADVPALLQRLGDRVRYLHIKDGPGTKDDPMTAVGTGTLPIPAILHANADVEWDVVELDECATDMLTALAESAAYLSRDGVR